VTVGLLGAGPAADAAHAALTDVADRIVAPDIDELGSLSLAVVIGEAGEQRFEAVNEVALANDVPWVGVELQGLGGHGHPVRSAAITGFGPSSACYHCLGQRVAAHDSPGSAQQSAGDLSAREQRFAGAVAGREAAGWLEGDSFAGQIVELSGARRSVLQVPHCPACGDGQQEAEPDTNRTPDPDRTHGTREALTARWGERSLEESIERAELAVDQQVGLVSVVGERDSFPAPYYLAQLGDTAGFSDASVPKQTAGVHAEWNQAYMKAIGEALERYSAGVYRSAHTRSAPEAELARTVSPTEFVRPESSSYDAREAIQWLEGEALSSGDSVWLPAEFLQFPPATQQLRPAITTGLGVGSSTGHAVRAGLSERLERDATMLAWYSTYEPLGLEIEEPGFETLAQRARSQGLTVTPLLVTQDVDVPVVSVGVHRDGEFPQFAVGSDAALDAREAARSALCEALQNWMELRALGPEESATASGAIGQYASFPEPAQQLVDPEVTVPVGDVAEAPLSGEAALETLLERIESAGLDAYAARLTPRDVEALGFEAVRVVVPSAQPLFVDEPYFGERATDVPRSLGFEPRQDREPHPYP